MGKKGVQQQKDISHIAAAKPTKTPKQMVIGFYGRKSDFPEFSNFHYAPFDFHLPEFARHEGWKHTIYCEVSEKAIMLTKAALMQDRGSFEEMIKTSDPAEVKQLGRRVEPWNQELWEEHLEAVAFEVVRQKFAASRPLRDLLFSTGDHILAEATRNDSIWGIGINVDDPRVQDQQQWRGRNVLGFALMRTREHLQDRGRGGASGMEAAAGGEAAGAAASSCEGTGMGAALVAEDPEVAPVAQAAGAIVGAAAAAEQAEPARKGRWGRSS